MRRTKRWTTLMILFGAFLVGPGCSDDDNGGNNNNNNNESLCGNGVIDPGEECDGVVEGVTCVDLEDELGNNYTGGILDCTPECTFDTSHCIREAVCGNGHVDQGEECDCGENPDNLPANCTDVNGGPNANCDENCNAIAVCGNGIVETGEQCDCGTSADNLPQGCPDVNGGPNANCDDNCNSITECRFGPIDGPCDPTKVGDCCPDDLGTPYECVSNVFTVPLCLETCQSTQECYVNMYCEVQAGGYCLLSFCGPGKLLGGELNGSCQIPGGREGYCLPLNWAEDEVGLCLENGDKQPGEDCQDYPGDIAITYIERQGDESEFANICAGGFCGTDGKCLAACNWRDSYYDTDTCPEGQNCVALSYFYMEDDPNSEWDDDKMGHRMAEQGICIEQSLDPQAGAYMCDIADPNMRLLRPTTDASTCADLDPDPTDATPMGCVLYGVGQQQGEIVAVPTGMCTELPAPTKDYFEECEAGVDICPQNAICIEEDVFANLNNAAGPTRCLPICNTEAATACHDLYPNIPETFTCNTYSYLMAPQVNAQGDPVPGATSDGKPAPLGICACPPTGCEATCGNGIVETGEQCDCGTDASNLPAGCDDVNGGANANCSDTCETI